jgi:hypothetical protein
MKKGTGWADADWSRFASHVKNVNVQLITSVGLLKGLTVSIASGNKLNGAQIKLQSHMDMYLARGAGSDPKAIGQLTAIATGMLNKLRGNIYANFVKKQINTAEGYPGFLMIGSSFYDVKFSDIDRDQILGHEIFHAAYPGNRDTRIILRKGGEVIYGYGRKSAERRAIMTATPLVNNLKNPDAVTFSLGFPGGK